MADCESAAMWRLYSHADEGVAVRMTYARLEASVVDAPHPVAFGVVGYLDFRTGLIPTPGGVNVITPFFWKRNRLCL
jgi:hypothetical protein